VSARIVSTRRSAFARLAAGDTSWGVARDLYREMGMTSWLERTEAELTELG
jgi:hypothetical protein